MQEYRAYIVGSDGHFIQRVELSCEDDDDAKAQAQQLVDSFEVELWQATRFVVAFRPAK